MSLRPSNPPHPDPLPSGPIREREPCRSSGKPNRQFWGKAGWAISSPDLDAAAQDDHDTTALYDLLEHQVILLFYE